MITTVISFFLGGIALFLATLVAERLKRPVLRFKVLEPLDVNYSNGPRRQAKCARFLQIRILNEDLPSGLKWLNRNAAMFCSGNLEFKSKTSSYSFLMPLRWSGAPEPVPMEVTLGTERGYIVDHLRFHQKMDIPAGESQKFDVVAQLDGESECYGWSNEAYLSTGWRNPRTKLAAEVYTIKITIFHLGGKRSFSCELNNLKVPAFLSLNDSNRIESGRIL